MGPTSAASSGNPGMSPAPRFSLANALALAFAMIFPTVVVWAYLHALGGRGHANPVQQFTYGLGKVVQFSFPLLFVVLVLRERPRWRAPGWSGLALGLGFGLLVAAAMFLAYFGWLRSSSLLAQTPGRIRHTLGEMGANTPLRYLALASFLCVAHALLEEYYWRWFVYGRLRRLLPLVPSLVLASAAFASHHFLLLNGYLPGKFLTGVLPAGLGVAIGGAVWAWIYERSGSLLAPWLSHLVIDTALFVIGWDLVFGGTA